MKRCIIFDIDGTLADLSHRVHHVRGKKKDWVAFMATLSEDKLISQTAFMNEIIADFNWQESARNQIPVFIVSGRSEDEREETEKWLYRYHIEYDEMFMRPAGDYRADHVIKKEILQHMRSQGYEPWIVFDDRQSVVDMWRSEGVFVFQCDPKKSFTDHEAYKFHDSIKFPLTIMVGPSGAGKSTFLKECSASYLSQQDVISSDHIREQLCGNFQDQSKNDEVFDTMHELASFRLRRGLPVVLDATHIRNADRIKAAKIAPNDVPVNYIVINRPISEKKRTGGWRNEVVVRGKSLIEYHEQVFQSNLKDILAGDNLPNVAVKVI